MSRKSNTYKDEDRKAKSSKYGRNRKKSNRSGKSEAVMSEKEVKDAKLINDPNWYFTDPIIANQASQLSFNHFLGSDESAIGSYQIPTIYTIMLNPSPGNTYPSAETATAGATSGFNMEMTKLYNRLSMKSGRNMAYAPQDVGSMYLAQGELVSLITYVRRAFAVAQTYNQRNRMFPKKILRAMGFDPDDFFENFSDYRMRFNTLLASINQIPILTESGYLRKCNSIYGGIYLDADNSMAQVYLFVPFSTWILDEASDSRGSLLKTTYVCAPAVAGGPTRKWKFADFMNTIMEPMVNALLTSSTLNLVYADMLNLAKYENIKFASFEPVQDSDTIVPEYNLMVLKQIHNLTFMGTPGAVTETALITALNDVVHDPDHNAIKYSPGFSTTGFTSFSHGGSEVIIDTDNSDPDVAERIEITRFTSAWSNTWATSGASSVNIFAALTDHYGVLGIIYDNDIDDDTIYTVYSYYHQNVPAALLYKLTQFDWAPILYNYPSESPAGGSEITNVLADLGFFTTVRSPYLRRLNQIIYMGLFEIRG